MKITILDGYSINPGDLTWTPIENLGSLTVNDRCPKSELATYIGDSDAIFVSKYSITSDLMDQCPNLKFIGVTATGFDNIDINGAKERNIAVCNVPAYSTESVAQHTFALLLELTNSVGNYNASVKDGKWYTSPDFTFVGNPLFQLNGKSLGIIGYGNIGKRIAEIAEAFSMKVNIYSRDKAATIKSDIISLHCPATAENKGFINKEFISQMKDGAFLINASRGALINENDLAEALNSGKLAGAAVDVLTKEPPSNPNPLVGAQNCILTPHIAWTTKEARLAVINTCAANLKSFIEGDQLNRLV
ncbi:MAG: D-2-hydroxyacid dehydrogenase [Anaerovoracaceae bacterium]